MLGRNYSAAARSRRRAPILSSWSENRRLTIKAVNFRMARKPGHKAASEPENDRVFLNSSNLGYFFNPSVKFVTSVTD
jgi:hypothetical protein